MERDYEKDHHGNKVISNGTCTMKLKQGNVKESEKLVHVLFVAMSRKLHLMRWHLY